MKCDLVDAISDRMSRSQDGSGQSSFADGLDRLDGSGNGVSGWCGNAVSVGRNTKVVASERGQSVNLTLPADGWSGGSGGLGGGEFSGEFRFSDGNFGSVLNWSWQRRDGDWSNWNSWNNT